MPKRERHEQEEEEEVSRSSTTTTATSSSTLIHTRTKRRDGMNRLRQRVTDFASSMTVTFTANENTTGGDRDRDEPQEEPLLVTSMRNFYSYGELAFLLRQINFAPTQEGTTTSGDASGDSSLVHHQQQEKEPTLQPLQHWRGMHLTPELMRRVARFLTIRPVNHEHVQVVGCSSHDNRHPLSSCLTPNEDTWWISAAATMNRGRGREHVDFQLCHNESSCRLLSFSLKIPPLPMGPLSVREFDLQQRVECFRGDGTSYFVYQSLALSSNTVQNVSGWQDFHLNEPVDVKVVRLVCLNNQISRFMDAPDSFLPTVASPYDQVGFFSIRFA